MNAIHKIMQAKHFKRYVITGFITLSILFWFSLWLFGKYYATTDDAYVNANVVQIAPRITGQVIKLYAENNQYVKQGEPLFAIDQDPFKVAFAKAEAQAAKSDAELINAKMTADRTMAVVKKNYLSQQQGDNVMATLRGAEANVKLAKAQLDQATLDLQWTIITAPTSGYITNMSLRTGDVVAANQPLFALISDQDYWIDANFKETELENIKPHQLAHIRVDMYPHHTFQGTVESLSGGTGAVFSLLPPQNATGNWVKVTQRVPVRIHVINTDPHYPLRIGTSASVRISLHDIRII